jgi:cell division protein ZapE
MRISMKTLTEIYDSRLASGTLTPDEDQKHAMTALSGLIAQLAEKPKKGQPAPRGYYFYGGVGRGKTMLMDMFFSTTKLKEKRRVHFHAFMLEVHDFLHERRSARKKGEAIDSDLIACADKIADEARLLCFDEFHVKDVADAMILGRLFTALFARGVVMVMTSNTAPDNLYRDGLQRDRFLPFIDLLKEKLEVIHFTGATDYRLNRLRGARTYYWPADADAHAEMEKIFAAVADGAAGSSVDISVKGRFIHVPKAAREAAWFTFSELCDTAKSAVDYLELAKIFRVFIIENVPLLDDMRHNAVLRFVTLVDTLYDHKARVALSAAAPPDKLYRGEMHAHAFERTASRLIEMQSKDYGEGP